ncbi:hypothetical protein GQ53DRAFT_845202 [Thozetella sp. PMI_491]|nr:hypothetical protein GQ53DRAFT_845202 [Thozetella sp. PMI_491]
MKPFVALVLPMATAVFAKDTFSLVAKSTNVSIDGKKILAGAASVVGQQLGIFTTGQSIAWSVHGTEVRDDESSHGRKFDASLVGAKGGPYLFLGINNPSKVTVPTGNVIVSESWAVGAQLLYTAETGAFYGIPLGDGQFNLTWSATPIDGASPVTVSVVAN